MLHPLLLLLLLALLLLLLVILLLLLLLLLQVVLGGVFDVSCALFSRMQLATAATPPHQKPWVPTASIAVRQSSDGAPVLRQRSNRRHAIVEEGRKVPIDCAGPL
jgi:hypothetical protein